MGLFDRFKKKQEVLDLVNLKKRGLIKDGDLGIEEPSDSAFSDATSSSKSSEDNPLGFLAGLASASDTSEEKTETGVDLGIGNRKRILREKIRTMENRLDSLSTQLQKVADRLELLEKKLERKS